VWIAFALMVADMEASCDERVMRELGASGGFENLKKAYAMSLVRLAAERRVIGASPLAFGEGGVKGRVKNVLNFKKRSRIVVFAAVVLAAALAVGLAVNGGNGENGYPEATINYQGSSSVITLGDSKHIPYVELGSKISLNFGANRPAAVSVIEVIANADGSRKYDAATDKTLDVAYSGSNLLSFGVEKNTGDMLSSNSDDYLPGNAFRWYRIICDGDGEIMTEYALWLRTDPAITRSREPAETPEPISYSNDEYGFAIAFTADWANAAAVAPIENAPGEFGISAPNVGDSGIGVAARIKTYPKASWEEDAKAVDERYRHIGEYGEYAFVLFIASDFPVDANDIEARELFAQMQDDLWAGEFEFLTYEPSGGPPAELTEPLPSSWAPLDELPADYGKGQAIADSVYVNIHGAEIYNESQLARFINDSRAGMQAFLREMMYTIEGDPIITDYLFDGETFSVTYDATRDKYGSQDITTRTYKYMLEYAPTAEQGYLGTEPILLLSNTQSVTAAGFDKGDYWQLPS
jgi:hypothetical protein